MYYNSKGMERQLSKDYELLAAYKANVTEESTTKMVNYFYTQYKPLIDIYFNRYITAIKRGSLTEIHDDGMNSLRYSSEWVGWHKKRFHVKVQIKYIPQALNSFKIEKIKTKYTYSFASYLTQYLSHAVRDMVRIYRRQEKKTAKYNTTFEEKILDSFSSMQMQESIQKARAHLTPLQNEILDMMYNENKRQKDIEIINPRSGIRYSKGYISKEVKEIRYWISKYL